MDNTILQVKELKTRFFTPHGVVSAVDGVTLSLRKGECLCLVGESGCGKTVTSLSILGLIDSPPGLVVGGEVLYHGKDLVRSSDNEIRKVRGNRIAMIFQDPQVALNPVLTIGDQVTEPIKLHLGLKGREADERAVQLMEQVGIPRAGERMKEYPHQFSGGMRQRVMIAAALSCYPEILIADEPTTALDTTIKAQIVDIFRELKEKREMSILFITHDMGTVADIADRIVVMYGGRIFEVGTVFDVFDHPRHPYTHGLLNCLPSVAVRRSRLTPIPGTIPSLIDPPDGCMFAPRCQHRMEVCTQKRPPEIVSGERSVACYLYREPADIDRVTLQ